MIKIMKKQITTRKNLIALAALLLLTLSLQATAQTPAQPSQVEPTQTQTTQAVQAPDVFGQLNLTPEQIQKVRSINMELRDERQAANLKLRQAQRALTMAVESPTPDEALINQRSREVAEAQAATIRLRSLTEARVLQTLTPEQRIKLREIRQQNQAARRANGQQTPRNGMGQRQNGLPRNGNAAQPLGPNQRKILRRQQRR